MGLTTEEIREVSGVMLEAFDVALATLNNEAKKKALELSIGLIHTEKPYRLFSAEGGPRLSLIAFDEPDLFDFLTILGIQFFSRWGQAPSRYSDLVNTLAYGIGISALKNGSNAAAMPAMFSERLPSSVTLEEFFTDNRWALVIAMMMVYLKLPDTMAQAGKLGKNLA